MVKIEINFTNKWLYTFFLVVGVLALGVGVYAVSHPNPGHTTSQIEGVCRSDGVDCLVTDSQPDLGLYINPSTNELCYPTASSASCSLEAATCSSTVQIPVSVEMCGVFESAVCDVACGNTVACDGDSTPFSCGTPGVVYYDQASVLVCNDAESTGDFILWCDCSISSGSQAYQKEIPDSSRCI